LFFFFEIFIVIVRTLFSPKDKKEQCVLVQKRHIVSLSFEV